MFDVVFFPTHFNRNIIILECPKRLSISNGRVTKVFVTKSIYENYQPPKKDVVPISFVILPLLTMHVNEIEHFTNLGKVCKYDQFTHDKNEDSVQLGSINKNKLKADRPHLRNYPHKGETG